MIFIMFCSNGQTKTGPKGIQKFIIWIALHITIKVTDDIWLWSFLRQSDSFCHDFLNSINPIFCFPQETIQAALHCQKEALQFIAGMKF